MKLHFASTFFGGLSARVSLAVTASAVALAALYGCSSSEEEPADEGAETEDKLILQAGNVDNAAIVESTTMLLVRDLAGFGPVAPPIDPLLDPYNQSDPFAIAPARFQGAFLENIVKFDAYDRKSDWTAEQKSTWASRMASGNYLVLDTSKPCRWDAPRTYLEIERAQLTGKPHETCGGRMPNEDAMDVTLNFMIRGPGASADDAEAIRDGVDEATQRASTDFPYLAEMNSLL